MPSDAGRLQVLLADDQVVAVRGAVLYLQALDIDVVATIDDPRRIVRTGKVQPCRKAVRQRHADDPETRERDGSGNAQQRRGERAS